MTQFGRKGAAAEPAAQESPAAEPAGAEVAVPASSEVAPISDELRQKVIAAVEGIPGDDGTGGEAIVRQLLDAQTIDDLNAPWEGTSGRNLNGKRLEIRGVTQRPSSFNEGAGIFLVADATDTKTGEASTFTTSALSVVIQLARAYQLGLFPIIADIVVAERPTARGFYPYHLRIVAAGRKQQ
jgi:hypothetical protein